MSENLTIVKLVDGATLEQDTAALTHILRVSTISNSLNSAFTTITKKGSASSLHSLDQVQMQTRTQIHEQDKLVAAAEAPAAEAAEATTTNISPTHATDNSLNDILLNVCCFNDPKDCTCFPDPADAGIHEHLRQERNRLLELEMQNYLKDGGERDHDACLFQGFAPESARPHKLGPKKDTPRPT